MSKIIVVAYDIVTGILCWNNIKVDWSREQILRVKFKRLSLWALRGRKAVLAPVKTNKGDLRCGNFLSRVTIKIKISLNI